MLVGLLILLSCSVILTGIEGTLLRAEPASAHTVGSLYLSDLHGIEVPASHRTASMSNAVPIKVSNVGKALIPSGNFKEIDVSLPSAQKEPANKSISPSVILVPSHFNSNFTTNSILTGSPSSTEQHTNLASQYPHLNENNMFQDLPPIADAGPAQVVSSGSTVVLNASNSKAENGKIVSYSWEQVPTNAKITLSGVNSPVWKFVAPPVAGDTILRFQLTVTDNLGQSGHDSVNILVKQNLGIHSQINPGMEIIREASKNSSLPSGQDSNTIVIPYKTKSNSPSSATATSTAPPLTPPTNSTGHRY